MSRLFFVNLFSAVIFLLFANFPLAIGQTIQDHKTEISRAFELRHFTNNNQSNGETDFKGETEYFDTRQRVEYLETYEQYARQFFDNTDWNKIVVTDGEAQNIAAKIKPQPLPEIRNRILLTNWKCLGYKEGKYFETREKLRKWNSQKNVSVDNESLLFEKNTDFSIPIPEQTWRSLFKQSVFIPENGLFEWEIGNAVRISQEDLPKSRWVQISVDLDLENERYNLVVDGDKRVDFKPIIENGPIKILTYKASKQVRIDNIHCVQYNKGEFTESRDSRDVPYSINTFLFENFKAIPDILNWQLIDYNDELWDERAIPYPHGGERFKDESLYMRKIINVPQFKVAELNLETIDPGGEIWVNGEIVHVQHHRHPVKIDVSKYLISGHDNILAVRVFPNRVEHTNRHTSADIYTGAFAGRTWIDFRDDRFIDEVFVYTKQIKGQNAMLRFTAELRNNDWQFEEREMKELREFKGKLTVNFYKWFPEEEKTPLFSSSYPVNIRLNYPYKLEKDIEIANSELWTWKNPNLYKVVCTLEDESGVALDDYTTTIGIRTISQEGGTFRINGEPEMMNGALLFGYKYPLEDIARTLRCGEEFWLVKAIEMVKRMNGNTIRMSVHHGMEGGINDPRFAEIGDQLGIMFQWQTSTWIRTGSPWNLDFKGLPKYIKQVRNHPSIIMWQNGNHPKFYDYDIDGLEFITKVYESIYPIDPSRFIVPVGQHDMLGKGIPNDAGTLNLRGDTLKEKTVWTEPMITRGNFDHTTGYGTDWTTLRNYPYPKSFSSDMGWRETGFRTDYLNSQERAYFDYESEESVGQPNWELRKGKPSYEIKSYELEYDIGSIGRQLDVVEWRTSQAWQAFSAYEAYRKKRWLDYDGQAWCTLHGGGNTATYQKPLIDYYGHAKLAFYTVRMAFQSVLAGSKNVDIAYGPEDTIPVVVMNLGTRRRVTVEAVVKDVKYNEVYKKTWSNIILSEGRSFTDLPGFKPVVPENGNYAIEYVVYELR